MNKRVGLWIDHEKAVIVSITDNGEDRLSITSDMEHYVRYSKSVPGDGSPEEPRDRRFWNHVGEYYQHVIAQLQDARAIQIFGPGDAKNELQKRLELAGLAQYIVSIDHAEKLTDYQVAVKVRARFPARSQFDIS